MQSPKVHTRVEKHVTHSLNGKDIISMLRKRWDIPDDAEVMFRVPGGADWSGTNIDIDDENPVIVWYIETSHEL